MHDHDLVGELRQEGRLLHRGVAAADHDDALAAEEGGVAGGAVRDAAALQLALRLEADLARLGAGRDDDGVRLVLLVAQEHAVRAVDRVVGELDAGDVVRHQLRAEARRLLAELDHQLGPHDALGEAGVVVDVGRDHQLSAVLEALEHQRRQVAA